jgi:HlyD family secretion protein
MERMERMQRIGQWIRRHPVWSGVIALGLALIAYAVFVPSQPTYAYVTETVGRGDVVSKVTASGKLRARNTIKVGAEVSGQITSVMVDFNSQVRAGQVLAVIDPTRFEARVQQARAQVALGQAALAQANAAMERAQAEVAIQQRNDIRSRDLVGRGFVSEAARDNVINQLAAARAGVATARAQIESARAQIQQSSAELANARLDLRRTVIIAPASGVIINRLVEPGTTVAASFQTPSLFEIAADITRMQVEASVDEADIGLVREGQRVFFTVDAYPGERFPANVTQIRKGPTETQNVVSYLTILEVDNGDGRLLPGMTANVEIITGTRPNVLRVATQALRFRPRAVDRPKESPVPATAAGQTGAATGQSAPNAPVSVYVATEDAYRPVLRQVQIGVEGEDFVEIRSGLRAGERVLVRSRSLEPRPDTAEDEDGADADGG